VRQRAPLVAIAVLVVVNIVWGINVAVVKLAVGDMSPYAFNALRSTMGACLLLPIGIRAGLPRKLGANPWGFLVCGLLGVTVTQTAYAVSLSLAPGSIVSVLSSLGPLLLVFMSVAILHEKVGRLAWVGVAVAFVGVLVVLGLGTKGLETNGSDTVIGSLVVLAGIVAWYSYQIAAKRLLHGETPLSMAAGTMLLGSVGLIVVYGGVEASGSSPASEWSSWAVFGLFFSGIGNGVVAFLALNWALKRLEGARIGGISYIHVVVGVLSSWILIGEDIGVTFVFGAAVVLAGVYIVSRAQITSEEPLVLAPVAPVPVEQPRPA
jgi:drug/metabolite transporter (DMT)-like permease